MRRTLLLVLPTLLSLACTEDGDKGDGTTGTVDDGGDGGSGDDGGDGGSGDDGSGEGSGETGHQDRDGDGFLDDVDCDDGNADVHPEATESCNGIDDDCDLSVDEGEAADGTTWFADADGDGFGDPDTTVVACSRPEGWTGDDSDCDDTDETIHPDADETCNGVDDDCDSLVDADDDDASGGATWYADTDGDGYGDPLAATVSCETPADHVSNDGDCDDTNASVSPDGVESCNGLDDDCDSLLDDADPDVAGTLSAWPDLDGDGWGDDSAAATDVCALASGWVDNNGDCDDTDSAISPDATEVCDGAVDEDCDGLVDDADSGVSGTSAFYIDSDGDGHGGSATTQACAQPSGTTLTSTDCDDTDAAISPAGTETCNGEDDDCDGDVDDDDSAVTGTSTWYADVDGDGYGAGVISTTACDAPTGFVSTDTDCDDTDAAVSPAASESCNGLDDDCDGDIDDDDTVTDVGSLTAFYLDGDGDGYGLATTTTTACDLPSGYADASGDCDDSDAAVSPGATEVCNGVDDDCDGDTDADDDDVTGASVYYTDLDGDGFGATGSGTVSCTTVSGAATVSGDCDDVDSSVSPGATEVCDDGVDNDCSGADQACSSGGGSGGGSTGLVDAEDAAVAIVYGEQTNEDLGEALSDAGDLNGDGIDDLIIGVESRYRALVFFGPLSGSLVSGDADWGVVGSSYSGDLGYSANALGDYDGDGQDDFFTGAPYAECDGLSAAGGVYLFHGPMSSSGTVLDTTADVTICGDVTYASVGILHHNAGDVDGDGEDDLLVGGWRAQRSGSTYSYNGAAFLMAGPITADTDVSAAAAYYDGEDSYGYVGRVNTFGSGDIDGDGLNDLVVSEYGDAVTYVLYGPASASGDLGTVADTVLEGGYGTSAGYAAGIGGDLDGDGLSDVVVGSYLYDYSSAETDAGRTYVWYGGLSSGTHNINFADARLQGLVKSAYQGWSLDAPGDLDGDGLDDLLVGARGDDEIGTDSGAAFIVWGAPSGTIDLDSAAGVKFAGPGGSEDLGWAVAAVGDVDADGTTDLAFGAPGHTLYGTSTISDAGAVYIVPSAGW